MEKITRSLSESFKGFQKRIESLLETDESKVDPDGPPFEASRDVSLLRDLPHGLPDNHVDRGIVIFSRLAAFYDSGMLLENHDGIWLAQAYFKNGIARPLRRDNVPALSLPQVAPLTVLTTSPGPLLARVGLSELDPRKRARACLIKPVPDFAYLLLSEWPDLWLKDHVERTLTAVASGFAG